MKNFLYYNGQLIIEEDDIVNNIVNNILKLSLKKGDTFELLPFNYNDDEISTYKGKKLDYHTQVKIVDIKIALIQSWNSTIKNKIEIFLENNI